MGRAGGGGPDPRHVRLGRRVAGHLRGAEAHGQEQFRATLSAVWSILNLLYAGAQLYQGHFTHEVWVMVLCCVPLIVLATAMGGKLAKRISQERFLKLTYVLLLVIGTVLLVTS